MGPHGSSCSPSSNGALMNPPWALVGRMLTCFQSLVGQALIGQALKGPPGSHGPGLFMGRALMGPLGPHGSGPNGPGGRANGRAGGRPPGCRRASSQPCQGRWDSEMSFGGRDAKNDV